MHPNTLKAAALLVFVFAMAFRPDGAAAHTVSADALFASASPAIAYVETPGGSGSAILFDAGYVLTDAHVVWPYDRVRVRFPDGTEFRDAPVAAWDWLGDLAVIRVGDVPGVRPLTFADPAQVNVGSEVYLVGYPAERERRPVPTIARGLVSRFRVGGPADLTFVQTDSVASPGVSGGAMLSASGDVLGIVQLRYPGSDFSLALSASQALDRARALLLTGDIDALGHRQFAAIGAHPVRQESLSLAHFWQQRAYMFRPRTSGEVTIGADSPNAMLLAYHASGAWVARSPEDGDDRSIRFEVAAGQPYVVIATQAGIRPVAYTLTSSEPLLPITDLEDGRAIEVGRRIAGNLDYVDDIDVFTLALAAGETITVTAESTLVDPLIGIVALEQPGRLLEEGQHSGFGILGNDAHLAFTAPADGTYLLIMGDSGFRGRGGYRLSVHASAPPVDAPGARTIVSGGPLGREPREFIFGGGSSEDLVLAAACPALLLHFWAYAPDGIAVSFVPGAVVAAVNDAWDALFPFGIPAGTRLVGSCAR